MADDEEEKEEQENKERKKVLKEACEKTRQSLIARLDDWEDRRTWEDFYQTYWRLIYAVGIKAGLRSEEAHDCVQETILSIAKQSKKKLFLNLKKK